ncbi:MAG: hypothetical protein Q7R30_02745 [Acidobacteriota bacterium]|nr:hypothetical protein [Acidobacteriota bacterium]
MPTFDPLSRVLGALAALLGVATAWHYSAAGLALSHYDAKAHLVVARRIFDSITPNWEQIGAVWLPLPHALNALPVQIDFMYRTGASAIAISVVSFAVTVACLSALVLRLTGSGAGAVLAAALFAINPNVLYLQSTPMTEPLLFALSALMVLHLTGWALSDDLPAPRAAGWTIVAAMLTRYEAWPIAATAMVLAAWVKWRRGAAVTAVAGSVMQLARYPAGAIVFFVIMSWITTGEWFVTGGFYVPDATLQGKPQAVYDAIIEGASDLAGARMVLLSKIAAIVLLVAAVRKARRKGVPYNAGLVLPIALLASAALPFYAFVSGHPFRIRYEVPLILGAAACIGAATGLLRRAAAPAAIAIVLAVMLQTPPFDRQAPMIVEAQLDRKNGEGRRAVTACLSRGYDGTTIMASMGALAHYMQELSLEGFAIADFLHEGNGPIWDLAVSRGPAPFAGWALVEEAAEGGDILSQRIKAQPRWLAGMERVCEGGNVALYRRIANSSS